MGFEDLSTVVLHKLGPAVHLEWLLQERLTSAVKCSMASTGCKGIHPLFSLENNILAISAQTITEGVLYILPVGITISDKKYVILSYMESGHFCGFVQCHIEKNVAMLNVPSDTEVLLHRTFTDWDMEAERQFSLEDQRIQKGHHHEAAKPDSTLSKRWTKNKASVANTLPQTYGLLRAQQLEMSGYVVCVEVKTKKVKEGRKLLMQGFDDEDINKLLTDFPVLRRETEKSSLLGTFCSTCLGHDQELSIQDQYNLLCNVPNHHKLATSKRSGVKWHNYLLESGSSPRQLLVHHIFSSDEQCVEMLLRQVSSKTFRYPYDTSHAQRRAAKKRKVGKQDGELVQVQWKSCNGEDQFHCTCDSHKTLSILAYMASQQESWEGVHCVHVLFLKEMLHEKMKWMIMWQNLRPLKKWQKVPPCMMGCLKTNGKMYLM